MSLTNFEILMIALALSIFTFSIIVTCLIVLTATVQLGIFARKSPVFLISSYHIFFDIVLLSTLFCYLYPSAISGNEITPQDGTYATLVGSIGLFAWIYLSISHVFMAFNRFLVICYNRHDLFTYSRIHYISFFLMLVTSVLTYVGQKVLPCCKLYYNYRVISQDYLAVENFPNYNSIYIITPLNILSTICSFIMYTYIFYFLKKAKVALKHSTRKTRNELRYALQFFAISIFHFLEYSSLRLLPLIFRPSRSKSDYNPIFTMPTVFVVSNCAMNSVVYLLTNIEVQRTVRKFMCHALGKSQVNITSTHSGFSRDGT